MPYKENVPSVKIGVMSIDFLYLSILTKVLIIVIIDKENGEIIDSIDVVMKGNVFLDVIVFHIVKEMFSRNIKDKEVMIVKV